jgi:5-formyltetrahydrofolate cyclo-ligase
MKEDIRKTQKQKRLNLTQDIVKFKSNIIVNYILKDINFINSSVVGLYYPINNEVDVLSLIDIDNKTYCLPILLSDNSIKFVKFDKNTSLKKSKHNIMEPIIDEEVKDIDYLIVPGLAINNSNYRIGYGMGCYDKYLSTFRPKHVVGVIYDFQLVSEEFNDSYDQKLDYFFVS